MKTAASWFSIVSSLFLFYRACLAGDAPGFDVQLDTVRSGFDKKTCWVHPRAGAIPGKTPKVVLTMQKLLLTGSDVFFALNEMRTDDLGKTWRGPTEHAETLGRREEPGGVIVAVCDFWPKWHAKSGKLLGTGHTVRYKDDKVIPIRKRETPYSIYDPEKRTWTAWETVAMPDEKKFYNAGAGCVQRLDLPNGDILLPIYYKAETEKFSKVIVLRCRFDGAKLTFVEHGNDLTLETDRGLGEPSLTRFRGRFYLTLRHDKAGYVSTSDDGLHFAEPKKWTWDDGTELGNYNTQQHWVTHDDALFLVYTRRGANNDHIMRHRAPLFIGQVDPEKLCVLRATERVLVPQRGARLGNFGVTEVSENETWVTVAEWMQTTPPNPYDFAKCMKYGSDNAVFAARIKWKTPNRSWNTR
ncbi:MAG: exo-alpha-sialidase [Verrucomicrobia bacterium]|nr:exo-alpha-sialidase [Verrucomicrobiota bacterium]